MAVSLKNGILRLCLLYTSDAADERSSVDLGGRRIIKKKKQDNKLSIRHTIDKNRAAQDLHSTDS